MFFLLEKVVLFDETLSFRNKVHVVVKEEL